MAAPCVSASATPTLCAELYDANAEGLLSSPGVLTPLAASTVKPGLAKAFQISADGKEVTFMLRKGIKWSDGRPSLPPMSSSGMRTCC